MVPFGVALAIVEEPAPFNDYPVPSAGCFRYAGLDYLLYRSEGNETGCLMGQQEDAKSQ
jgi:hypothetical protein